MKTCSNCLQSKDDSEYYKRGKRKDTQSYCKACFNKYCAERWKEKKKKFIEELGGCCQDCTVIFHPFVFEFHHLRDKDIDWRKLRGRKEEHIREELSKCILLCANCHRLRHAQEGY